MTTFEYIAVLVSIIVGLGIAHLLAGVGRLIGDARKTRPYWVHLVWTAYAFTYLVFFWWWEFRLAAIETWTFELYLFVIAYAVFLYLLAVVLYPEDLPEGGDFKRYYYDRRAWFLGLLVAIAAIDFIDSAVKGLDYLLRLGPEYWTYLVATSLLYLLGIRVKDERFHAFLAIGSLVYLFVWAFRLYGTVS